MSALVVNVPGNADLEDPTRWEAWAHVGHRLWAAMPEEFWFYEYKVPLCSYPFNHEWTACPYAHNGEPARRRDPRRFLYIDSTCPDYHRQVLAGAAQPSCWRGLECRLAHGVHELLLHPSRFRTSMCRAGPNCQRPICLFAHFPAELRGNGHIAAASMPLPLVYMSPPIFHCAPSAPPASASVAVDDSRDQQLLHDMTLQSTPNSRRLQSLYSALGDEHMASAVAVPLSMVSLPEFSPHILQRTPSTPLALPPPAATGATSTWTPWGGGRSTRTERE